MDTTRNKSILGKRNPKRRASLRGVIMYLVAHMLQLENGCGPCSVVHPISGEQRLFHRGFQIVDHLYRLQIIFNIIFVSLSLSLSLSHSMYICLSFSNSFSLSFSFYIYLFLSLSTFFSLFSLSLFLTHSLSLLSFSKSDAHPSEVLLPHPH